MITTGLINGPSHEHGGIAIVVKETHTHKEVEGQEYVICTSARLSTEVHEFNNATNREILDKIHSWYGCPEFNPEISATDFILCKLVVNDKTKHARTGTVQELLNSMQEEHSCVVSSMPHDHPMLKQGGPACGCQHEEGNKLAKGGPADEIDRNIIAEFPKLSKKEVQENYNQVLSLLSSLNRPINASERKVLEQYEGRGNQFETGTKIDEGLVHQFYTPYIITKKMWDLAHHYGFNGGNVLEPSCGTGRFFKYAPKNTRLFAFDLDETNIKIAKLLYPQTTFYKQEFETAFLQEPNYTKAIKKSWLPEMDLIIGNPPYGDYAGYFKTYMPNIYKRFEFLFIRLGLQLLKPGGLLIYIISQNLMNNGATYNKMKENILDIGTFVDSFRMPNGIFASTQVGTDIVIFKRK